MWSWFSKSRAPQPNDDGAIMAAERVMRNCSVRPTRSQAVELGTITYLNLEGNHGNIETALNAAQATGKPIFANFVEFPG